MIVLLLQLDGKIPNLALMRLAAHHRSLGDTVELRRAGSERTVQRQLFDPRWDRVYGSLIFERTKPLAEVAQKIYPGMMLGGTGWDFEDGVQVRKTDLPSSAERCAPEYSGYVGFEESIGFTQRGCRFACDFCVVPRKEGKVKPVSTLLHIWRGEPHPKRVVLLDNDFFGNKHWPQVIEEARAFDIAIAVIQGINVRILSDEQAAAIASVRWMADDFSRTRVYTAWDRDGDERAVFRGLERLRAHGIAPDSIMVYMLIGHESGEVHADRDRRRQKLREWGARPYPMAFRRDDELQAFQRWVIQRADLHVSWEDWWGKAHGEPRKLGDRRVSLPLFPEVAT